MAQFILDADDIDGLQEAIEQYGDGAKQVINDVLHDFGANEIKENIQRILPASGRRWRKKRAPARAAQPFTQQNGMLETTVKTVKRYNYLYFPDDGSNTKRHAGNQQFMRQGAENASARIIEQCVGRLIEEMT